MRLEKAEESRQSADGRSQDVGKLQTSPVPINQQHRTAQHHLIPQTSQHLNCVDEYSVILKLSNTSIMSAPKGRKLVSSLRARGHVISQQLNVAARSSPKGFSITQSKASKTEIIFSYDSSEPPPTTARTPTEYQDLHDPKDLKFFVRPGHNTMQYLKPAHKAVHRTRSRLHELKRNPSMLMDFSTSAKIGKGLSPESEEPKVKEKTEEKSLYASAPAELTNEKYHELSDEYLNALVEKLEELQEETEEVDVEYSVRLLSILPPWTQTDNLLTGWSPHTRTAAERHICHKQTTTEQADLALVTVNRAQEIRLRDVE